MYYVSQYLCGQMKHSQNDEVHVNGIMRQKVHRNVSTINKRNMRLQYMYILHTRIFNLKEGYRPI